MNPTVSQAKKMLKERGLFYQVAIAIRKRRLASAMGVLGTIGTKRAGSRVSFRRRSASPRVPRGMCT